MCLVILVLALAAPLWEQGDRSRVHQHLDAPEKELPERQDGFSTHLPLVIIETAGQMIPGKAIEDKYGLVIGYTKTEAGSEYIIAHMDVLDEKHEYNHLGDTAAVSCDIEIHIRGRSSRTYDKSGYSIRLINPDGSDNNQEIMGMDSHHEWVLHGPYLDKTLMRNYMFYNIGGEIMDYAPNVRFCEVMLNGEYQGVYVMMERITTGNDGARLNLSINTRESKVSGYLLRLDLMEDPDMSRINNFTRYAKRTKQDVEILYPGESNLTPELVREITNDFSAFEKALYSYDYDSKDYGYKEYIDVQSFVDYFLINEFLCNYDAGWLSTYLYKDLSGKYRMCLWDMNSAADNYKYSQTDPMGFQMQNCLWYSMLVKNEDFVNELIERYWQLREIWFNEEYLDQYIDDVVRYLGDAIDRNYEVWGYTFQTERDLLIPDERNPRTYNESIEQMKDFFAKRIKWMDDNIETLRQYSSASKNKKFNEATE